MHSQRAAHLRIVFVTEQKSQWILYVAEFALTNEEWQNENRRRKHICRSFVSLFKRIKICRARIFLFSSNDPAFFLLFRAYNSFQNLVLHVHMWRRQRRCRHRHRRLPCSTPTAMQHACWVADRITHYIIRCDKTSLALSSTIPNTGSARKKSVWKRKLCTRTRHTLTLTYSHITRCIWCQVNGWE